MCCTDARSSRAAPRRRRSPWERGRPSPSPRGGCGRRARAASSPRAACAAPRSRASAPRAPAPGPRRASRARRWRVRRLCRLGRQRSRDRRGYGQNDQSDEPPASAGCTTERSHRGLLACLRWLSPCGPAGRPVGDADASHRHMGWAIPALSGDHSTPAGARGLLCVRLSRHSGSSRVTGRRGRRGPPGAVTSTAGPSQLVTRPASRRTRRRPGLPWPPCRPDRAHLDRDLVDLPGERVVAFS